MSRSLRIEYPGAYYHVMNRGINRQSIFHNNEHFNLFLKILLDVHEKYQLEVHAYCLMNNHYHLLVRTQHANLHKIMQHLNGVFAQKYNRLDKRDGPLFKGRYKAILVEKHEYLLQLSRYIHLNPIEAKIISKPEDYLWSSYQFYINQKNKPKWLHCDETLGLFKTEDPKKSYIKFVMHGIDLKGNKEIEEQYNNYPILGTDKFTSEAAENYIVTPKDKEIPEYLKIKKYLSYTIADVINIVAKYFNITNSEVIKRNKNFADMPRKISIYLSMQIPNQRLKDIGVIFENISYSYVSHLYTTASRELAYNTVMQEHIKIIKKQLQLL